MMRWAHWVLAKYTKPARAAKKPCKHLNSIWVCADFFRQIFVSSHAGRRRFSVEFRAPFRTQVAPDSHHRAVRCWCLVSQEFCVCATTRIRFLQINFWLGLGAVAALLSRVWFYASLSHKIFAPINICRFTSWIGLMLSSARRELRWCKQMEF